MAGENYPRVRIEKLRRRLEDDEVEGVIIAPGPNLRYYTGVESMLLERPFLFFVPNEGEPHLIAPTLEAGPYRRLSLRIRVHDWDDGAGPGGAFRELISELKIRGRWGSEGRVPFGFLQYLMKLTNTRLGQADPILQSIRELKEPEEIRCLNRAASILSRSFLSLPGLLKPSITELELAGKLREAIYSNGGESVDFCLVQAGENAADPHHQASSRKVRNREVVLVDAGCTYHGYNADITRTLATGRSAEFESAYANVLEAQEKAIRASRSGAKVGSVDKAARDHLKRSGLGRYFIHRTGHGLGLEIHESPYVVPRGSKELRPSMAFTIEPGVYFAGRMGIRIEDNVILGSSGPDVITSELPKEFGWWT